MQGNQIMEPLTSRIVDITIMLSAFLFNAILVDADLQSLGIAVAGSFSGSIILAYFRRDLSRTEMFFKVVASAIGGLILGSVLQKYLHLESSEYRLGLFFVCSMLALAVLRALLQFTERNAVELLRETLQRMLNLKTTAEKPKQRIYYRRRKPADLDKKE